MTGIGKLVSRVSGDSRAGRWIGQQEERLAVNLAYRDNPSMWNDWIKTSALARTGRATNDCMDQ
jgi:hypothetical protein